jgi:glycosidase
MYDASVWVWVLIGLQVVSHGSSRTYTKVRKADPIFTRTVNIDVGTGYGMAYHGYWVQDPTRLNPRFGTSDDLKYLSAELHKRDMFLMVDIVVNNVVATPGANVTQMVKDDPNILWRDDDMFHPECWIDYNNASSVEQWLV